jgi:cytochrome c-type biogenesis protein CcmH
MMIRLTMPIMAIAGLASAKRWGISDRTVGVYLVGGAPSLPGRPAPQAAAVPGADGRSMEQLVTELGTRLAQRPDDAQGWSLYARSLASMGRMREAAPAFERAAALDPNNADLQSRLGEALSFANGGAITPAAAAAFNRALGIDPDEPRALYYLGLADRQAGRGRTALDRWLKLDAHSAPDAPWRALLKDRIAVLARELGLDAAALAALREKAAASPPAAAPPLRGPSAADVEAAQSMSAQDRTQMIRGMVARLAERMRETPDDLAGWERLARSYGVLGDAERQIGALAQVARLKPQDVAAQTGYARALAAPLKPDDAVPPELAAVAARILALDPNQPGALYFAGVAAAQAGDRAGALARWEALRRIAPPDAPILNEMKQRIDALDRPGR